MFESTGSEVIVSALSSVSDLGIRDVSSNEVTVFWSGINGATEYRVTLQTGSDDGGYDDGDTCVVEAHGFVQEKIQLDGLDSGVRYSIQVNAGRGGMFEKEDRRVSVTPLPGPESRS